MSILPIYTEVYSFHFAIRSIGWLGKKSDDLIRKNAVFDLGDYTAVNNLGMLLLCMI